PPRATVDGRHCGSARHQRRGRRGPSSAGVAAAGRASQGLFHRRSNMTAPSSLREPVEAPPSLALLIEELTKRLQRGEEITLSEVARELPQHTEQLAQVWPALQALADLSRSGGSGVGAGEATSGEPPRELGDFRIVREVG